MIWRWAPWPATHGAAPTAVAPHNPGNTSARRNDASPGLIVGARVAWPATSGAAPVLTEVGGTTPGLDYWRPTVPAMVRGPAPLVAMLPETREPLAIEITPLNWAGIPPVPVRRIAWTTALFAKPRQDTPSAVELNQTMWEPTLPIVPLFRPLGRLVGAMAGGGTLAVVPPAPDTALYSRITAPAYIWPLRGLAAHHQRWLAFVDNRLSPVPALDSWTPTLADFARTLRRYPELWPAVIQQVLADVPSDTPLGILPYLRYYRYKHHH